MQDVPKAARRLNVTAPRAKEVNCPWPDQKRRPAHLAVTCGAPR